MDFRLQARSYLYPATMVSTGVICGFILLPPVRPSPMLAAFLVFMDPATIGLSFVGAMVLLEKTQGTLLAVAVSPMRPWAYVCSKAVSLTLLTFVSSLAVVFAATSGTFDIVRQLIALTLCSAVAVLIGFVCVARAASMNHLVVTLLWVTTLLYVPLLSHFDVLPPAATVLIAAIPSHAMLVALTASIDPTAVTAGWQIYALLYLVAWCVLGWRLTVRVFVRSIATDGK